MNARRAFTLLLGPEGSRPRLTVRGANNRLRTVVLGPRARGSYNPTYPAYLEHTRGPAIQILPGNIGYADLSRLSDEMVDSMYAMLGSTGAIIFDARGYPRLSFGDRLSARLADRDSIVAQRIRSWVVLSPKAGDAYESEWSQTIPTSNLPRYRGKTVALIDERAQSRPEVVVLWLQAANGTTVIGAPSAGALQVMGTVALPGDFVATLPRVLVGPGAGPPIERVGIRPDIAVSPTIAGIRAGRDEILERALAFLRSGR
jgi:hypothetical protein